MRIAENLYDQNEKNEKKNTLTISFVFVYKFVQIKNLKKKFRV